MGADAAVSLAVVIAGLLIIYTGWSWLDSLVSPGIVAVIVWGTWDFLRESAAMVLDAIMEGIDGDSVATCWLACLALPYFLIFTFEA